MNHHLRSPLPQEIPESFFSDLAGADSSIPLDAPARAESAEGTPALAPPNQEMVRQFGTPVPPGVWQPNKILPWYDAIIDDMFAHPGGTIAQTAARLQRNKVTVGLIVRSDLFKSRYEQRRAAYNLAIQERLTSKLVAVAEAALDHTKTALDKKQDQVPLPILKDIARDALDRLGYAPQSASNPTVAVQVNNNNSGGASVEVSPADLASARERLRLVEGRNAVASVAPPSDSPREGGVVIDGGLDAL